MERPEEYFRIHIESYRSGEKAPLTAGALGLSLTVVNRILNNLSYEDQQRHPRYSPTIQEPPFANLVVTELRNGSALVDGFVQAAQHPFVQNVAGSIAGAILYEHGIQTIRTLAKQLRRLAIAEDGNTLVIHARIGPAAFEITTNYEHGRMHQRVTIGPADDVQ